MTVSQRVSRRSFLHRVAQLAGTGAMTEMLRVLEPVERSARLAADMIIARAPTPAPHVVVIGAGVCGLVAAYELLLNGYRCTVLESSSRPGGRSWTIRDGDAIQLTGMSDQRGAFQGDGYLNAGPFRILSNHAAMLRYCRELRVPLEVCVSNNRNALLRHPAFSTPRRQSEVLAGSRAEVAELLSKCMSERALDAELKGDDKQRLREFLRAFGRGRTDVQPDVDAWRVLLNADVWKWLSMEERVGHGSTMLQPKGGMDRIAVALAARVGAAVRYLARVDGIAQTQSGVRVEYSNLRSGTKEEVAADFCVCTLPPPIVAQLSGDIAVTHRAANAGIRMVNAGKIAWQAPRFWELESQIYGGVSYATGPAAAVWYPSEGFHADTGTLVGAYTTGVGADLLSSMPLSKQFEVSRAAVDALHPGHGRALAMPLSVWWSKMPGSQGAWARPPETPSELQQRAVLLEADRRIYFAGDHLSDQPGWQEGAVLSARRAISALQSRFVAQ